MEFLKWGNRLCFYILYSTCQSVCFQSGDDLIRRRHRPRASRGDQQHHVSECACSNVHIKVTVFLPFPPLSLSREFPIRCARFCRAKGRVHSLRDVRSAHKKPTPLRAAGIDDFGADRTPDQKRTLNIEPESTSR